MYTPVKKTNESRNYTKNTFLNIKSKIIVLKLLYYIK